MEYGHYVYPLGAWIRVPGGRTRLVLASSAVLAIVEHAGERVLCGLSGAGIAGYGIPEIFNTDQGCQFTAEAFTGVLKAHGIAISMDGRGRALDNIFVERLWRSVKHEDVYLRGYATMPELLRGLTEYFVFYNTERRHQSLDYRHRTRSTGPGVEAEQGLWINSARKNTLAQKQKQKQKTGAAPFRCSVKGYPLKLDALLS